MKTDEVNYPVGVELVSAFIFDISSPNSFHFIRIHLKDDNPDFFFRLSQKCLLDIGAISKMHHYFNCKLKIDTHPPFTSELVVSKMRLQDFKDWPYG
jgi:hypothetical protein